MSFIFGGSHEVKTPKDPVRESRRAIQRGVRQLDKDTTQMRSEEKKLLEEVRTGARMGDIGALSATAKQLVNTRACMQRNDGIKNKMKAMDRRFADVKSCTTAVSSMKALTACMHTMQQQDMDMAGMSRVVREFERANGVMDANIEMIEEAMDDMVEPGDDQDAESRKVVELVLAEVGLDLFDVLASVPTQKSSSTASEQELELRLMHLKS